MKKTLKIMISVLVCAVLCLVPCSFAGAESESAQTATLRIEGIEKTVFYAEVPLKTDDKTVVKDVISAALTQDTSLEISGLDTDYITSINGDTAGSFGGYDGWLFRVNGVDASVGINECEVKSGDNIVLFYGDPFGQGMQYPVADISRINEGIIVFTSADTTYDENFNPTESVNPVQNALITFCGKSYTTDENGSISVDKSTLANDTFALKIERYADDGLPTVLRFAPDYTVTVSGIQESSVSDEPSEVSSEAPLANASDSDADVSGQTENPNSQVPKTADSFSLAAVCALLILSLCAFCALTISKRFHA